MTEPSPTAAPEAPPRRAAEAPQRIANARHAATSVATSVTRGASDVRPSDYGHEHHEKCLRGSRPDRSPYVPCTCVIFQTLGR